jgi:hypothetical protein
MEQSSTDVEKSTTAMEHASMSAADDVYETQTLFEQLAERLAPKADDKEAVGILHKELRHRDDEPLFTWNRVFELLKGRARRVDAWEKEFAKRRIAEFREAERRRLENEYLDWLVAAPAEHRGPMLNRLEQALRTARGGDSPVATPEASDANADYDQREFEG